MKNVNDLRPQIRCAPRGRSAGAVLGRAAVAGGLVAAGAAFGVALSLPSPARAGEHNYVKSSSHEAVAQVRLDEEITILFQSAVWGPSVGPDTIFIRTGSTNGEQADGTFETGQFMYDRGHQRRVVVRPEAIQEYYQLIKRLPREVAAARAAALLRRIESTGQFRLLNSIDAALTRYFGVTAGAGTRLDDATVLAPYPSQLNPGDPLADYRLKIAGNDANYQQYLAGNLDFARLQEDSEAERFWHDSDPATGEPETASVLRGREYRRVLIDRRRKNQVMFVPNVPIRGIDLADTGFQMGAPYTVVIPSTAPGVFNTVLTQKGRRPLLKSRSKDYTTYFTTMPGTVTTPASVLFQNGEGRSGLTAQQTPRIINQTPPVGESSVDSRTDWENPDASRRNTFTVRLRFAQPLDPRTVNPSNFSMRELTTNAKVQIGTFLNQKRLGIVEVEVTPQDVAPDNSALGPSATYFVEVLPGVQSLGGQSLGTGYSKSFSTAVAPPPLTAILEYFPFGASPDPVGTNMANPADPDTFGPSFITTAYWPATTLTDPGRLGVAQARFMPFAGTGIGFPRINPVLDFTITDPAQVVQFVTIGEDPVETATYGKQKEYHYRSFTTAGGTITARGPYPLVIRSQTDITVDSTLILLNGQDGESGRMNVDTVNGDVARDGIVGGSGGAPGVGGYRGGDGGGAALRDTQDETQFSLDGFGRMQFDQAKINGEDGRPGFRSSAGLKPLIGGGHGGYSGDNDVAIYDANGDGSVTNDDLPVMPERAREPGGGGGHATAGGNGTWAGRSRQSDANGDRGGFGGGVFGDSAFSTAPLNVDKVPTLGAGFGGGGGGGGGAELDGGETTVGYDDAGGGGGGGGGGALQMCARGTIDLNAATVQCVGGAGGDTRNASNLVPGQGAPGGAGAGGSIWLQAFEGEVVVRNGATLWAQGGDVTNSRGSVGTNSANGVAEGYGGTGGDGYVRIEDATGLTAGETTTLTTSPGGGIPPAVRGVLTSGVFAPQGPGGASPGSYPGRTDAVPMIVTDSDVFSKWINTLVDTPTFAPVFDDTNTPEVEGTILNRFQDVEPLNDVIIYARASATDNARPGHPNLFAATPWARLDRPAEMANLRNRRWFQYWIHFTVPQTHTFDQPLPYVDFLQVNIELQ